MTNRLKATGLMIFMFLLGVGSDIAWHRCHGGRHPFSGHMMSQQRFARLSHDLQLTPDQEKSVRFIIDNAHARAEQVHGQVEKDLAAIHRDSVDSVRKVLTPQQVVQFEKIHERIHRRHHTPMEGPRGDAPPPPPPDDRD